MANRSTRLVLTAFVWRQAVALVGFGVFLALALAVAALATWNVADPSFSYATDNAPTNILGFAGAAFADLMMQFFGLASLVALLPVLAFALALIAGRKYDRVPARLAAWGGGTLLASAMLGCFPAPLTWPIPNGIGGVIGDMILRFPALFVGAYPTGTVAMVLGCLFIIPCAWLMLFASGLVGEAFAEDVEDDDQPVAAAKPVPSARRSRKRMTRTGLAGSWRSALSPTIGISPRPDCAALPASSRAAVWISTSPTISTRTSSGR